MARRYVYTRQTKAQEIVIPEHEVFHRTLSAIRVLNAQGAVRPAGAKSSWPEEFEHVATAIKWAVWRGKPLEDKLYRKLTVHDFSDIWFGETEGGEDPQRQRFKPRQIADALVAGAWFAALQRLSWNANEAIAAQEAYQIGRRTTALIDDQKIITWFAQGFSTHFIGSHRDIKLSDTQVGARLDEISASLFQIANGRVTLCNLDEIRRHRKRVKAGHAQGRARVRA